MSPCSWPGCQLLPATTSGISSCQPAEENLKSCGLVAVGGEGHSPRDPGAAGQSQQQLPWASPSGTLGSSAGAAPVPGGQSSEPWSDPALRELGHVLA